jgi:hypothetical protein
MATKDAEIARLRKRLREQEAASSVTDLKKLARNHKRLLAANASRRAEAATSGSGEEWLNEAQELLDRVQQQAEQLADYERKIDELSSLSQELSAETTWTTKVDGKMFNAETRMLVYTCVVNQVPASDVPCLLKDLIEQLGRQTDGKLPTGKTVNEMVRELGIFADLKAGDLLVSTPNLTLGFDATTQEGVHINSIHITSEVSCDVLAVGVLPGSTAEDYHDHITTTIDNIARVYADFHKDDEDDEDEVKDYDYYRKKMIGNISNTMTDRAAVNHACIRQLQHTWGKRLNELNCHLHPLDTISSSCRSALSAGEAVLGDRGRLFGKDCMAGRLVLQINKMRY